MKARFFASADAFRSWLEKHHATEREIWVGYYKRGAEKRGIRYIEAVEEALCFGWIDGQVKSIDESRYIQRFTPRRAGSNWSNLNVKRVAQLKAAGKMHSAGWAAFEARESQKPGVYSFENPPAKLPAAAERKFRAQRDAWTFWSAQPAGYRRITTWWVVSAKQKTTRERRLALLIEACVARRRIR